MPGIGTRRCLVDQRVFTAMLRGYSRRQISGELGELAAREVDVVSGWLASLPADAELLEVKVPERQQGLFLMVWGHLSFSNESPLMTPSPREPTIPAEWEYVK